MAEQVASSAFERGLLLETAGPESEVAKIMPALTITDQELTEGLDIFADAVRSVVLGGATA
jgi:diaminobutyrate-2-oxoglutarate transaminase